MRLNWGTVIVHQAHGLNDQVVDSPIRSGAMKFIVDTKLLSLGVPHLTIHLSIRSVYSLIRIDEFLIVARLDLIHIGLLQQVAKDFYKLRCSSEFGAATAPPTNVAPSAENRADKDGLAQPFSVLLLPVLPLELSVSQNLDHLIHRCFDLCGGAFGEDVEGIHEWQRTHPQR